MPTNTQKEPSDSEILTKNYKDYVKSITQASTSFGKLEKMLNPGPFLDFIKEYRAESVRLEELGQDATRLRDDMSGNEEKLKLLKASNKDALSDLRNSLINKKVSEYCAQYKKEHTQEIDPSEREKKGKEMSETFVLSPDDIKSAIAKREEKARELDRALKESIQKEKELKDKIHGRNIFEGALLVSGVKQFSGFAEEFERLREAQRQAAGAQKSFTDQANKIKRKFSRLLEASGGSGQEAEANAKKVISVAKAESGCDEKVTAMALNLINKYNTTVTRYDVKLLERKRGAETLENYQRLAEWIKRIVPEDCKAIKNVFKIDRNAGEALLKAEGCEAFNKKTKTKKIIDEINQISGRLVSESQPIDNAEALKLRNMLALIGIKQSPLELNRALEREQVRVASLKTEGDNTSLNANSKNRSATSIIRSPSRQPTASTQEGASYGSFFDSRGRIASQSNSSSSNSKSTSDSVSRKEGSEVEPRSKPRI